MKRRDFIMQLGGNAIAPLAGAAERRVTRA
jgi:hypothetical protein